MAPFNLLLRRAFLLAPQNRLRPHVRQPALRVLLRVKTGGFVAGEPVVCYAYGVLVRRHFKWVESPIVRGPVNHVTVAKGKNCGKFRFKFQRATSKPTHVRDVSVGDQLRG